MSDGYVSPLSAERAAGTARRWEGGEKKREVEKQPEAALERSSGGEERRLAMFARPGTLALDQHEGGEGPGRAQGTPVGTMFLINGC